MRWLARSDRPFDRRLTTTIGLLAASTLATLAVLRGTDLAWRRDQALALGERRAGNLALVLAAYLREAFEAVDASLRDLAVLAPRLGGATGPPAEWTPVLDSIRSGHSGIGSLSVVDAQGTIRHSTIPLLVGQSRRDDFLFQRLAAATGDALVANTPFRSRLDERTILLPLGRRLSGDGGRFEGAIVASFLPAQLREFFRTVDVGAQGTLWVFHPAGFILFREPSAADPIGETAAGNPILEAARQRSEPGVLRGPADPGGPTLLSAFQPLGEPALIVAVSLSEAEVLADWRREVAVSLGALVVFGLLLAAGVVLLTRQVGARAAAEQALARAQRLEAIGQLTGGVAHDFNNLLTVILGNVSLLRMREASAERGAVGDALREIDQAAQRAAELTSRLLTFARRQPLQPQIVDLNDLAAGLRPMLARLLGEDVALRLKLCPSACLANIDPVQAETALLNLCVNSRDAMPRGGLLVVETAPATLDADYARGNAGVQPGRYVMIAVSDTGEGIPPEHMARLFEPFFTSKEPGRGTGLGLSMVYGFVRQSQGHVKVYSEVGRGTTVKVYFPQATAAAPAERTAQPAAEAGRGGGETILLVEDEPGVRKLAAALLRGLGYRVLVAEDGPGALALAGRERRIDLLFTDVMLPKGLNGRQVAEELGRQRPGLSVLYASGYTAEVIQHRGELEPGLNLILKPYGREALAAAVRAALAVGRDA